MKKIWNVSRVFIAFAAITFCLVYTAKVIGGQGNISPAGPGAIIPPECTGDRCFKVNGNSTGEFFASKGANGAGACIKVQNDYSRPIFIPHKTLSEFTKFRHGSEGGRGKNYTIIGASPGPCVPPCIIFGDACPVAGTSCCGDTTCQAGICDDVDGGWTGWSVCSRGCAPPAGTKTRTCTNPPPSTNGAACPEPPGSSTPCGGGGCAPPPDPACSFVGASWETFRNHDWCGCHEWVCSPAGQVGCTCGRCDLCPRHVVMNAVNKPCVGGDQRFDLFCE